MRKRIYFPLLLFLAVAAWAQAWTIDIYVNGTFAGEVPARYLDGSLLLEARTLAKVMNVPIAEAGEQVSLNQIPIPKSRLLNRVPYVDAVEFVVAFHLKGDVRDQGGSLSLWTPGTAIPNVQANLSLVKTERASSSAPNSDTFIYTVTVRNLGPNPIKVSADDFSLVDSEEEMYDSDSDFATSIGPGQTVQLDPLYFSVPTGKDLKALVLLSEDLEMSRLRL